MGYPQRLLTDDETILHEFRPHWKALIAGGLWTVVAVALVAVTLPLIDERGLELAVVAVVVVGWLWLAGAALVRWLFTQYVLTTERIVVRQGVVARSGTEIPLESINNVLFNQTVVERLLGYGDVIVESAGSLGQSRLTDIPDPEAFQSEVYRARERRTLHFESGHGAPRDSVAQLEALADLHARGSLTDAEFELQKRRILDSG